MVLGGANYSALAPPRWKHDDIITIITTFPLIISSIIITADCAIICPGRTSTCWTSRQRSYWPRRWFVLLAMTPPTWSTSGGRWWQGWWWWWWSTMWSSSWWYQRFDTRSITMYMTCLKAGSKQCANFATIFIRLLLLVLWCRLIENCLLKTFFWW